MMNQNPNQNPFKNEFLEKNLQDDFAGEKLAKKPFLSRKVIVLSSAIGTLLLIFVVIPLILLGLIRNDSPTIPNNAFVRLSPEALEIEVEESTFLISPNSAEITLRESFINQFIFNYIVENENGAYRQRTLCESDQCRYIYHEYHLDDLDRLLIGIKAIWITIEDERLFVHVAIDYDDVISLSTVLTLEVEVTNNLNELRADVTSVRLNRLRVPQVIINQILDVVAESASIELAFPYEGNVDINLNELSISILQRNMRKLNDFSQYQVDDVIIRDGGIIFITRFSE
jgi:hypothetical protein